MCQEGATHIGVRLVLCLILSLSSSNALRAQNTPDGTGAVRGTVFTVESDQGRSFVPGARIRIEPVPTGAPGSATTSDEVGSFAFNGLLPGRYRLSAEFSGMTADPVEVTVTSEKTTDIEIALRVASLKESITVSGQTETLDLSQTSTPAVLNESALKNAPNINERFESLLPLLPGVVRGPDGLINMKGGRSSQGGMLLNSANVTDPVTGSSGINLPIDVISSAQVVANPYDPEYGKLAGAVATIDTHVSDFDKFRFRVQNFMPRMRKRDGSIVGIESSTPRMTITGPLRRRRAALTQSFEYRYVRTPVETLPPLERDTGIESFDSYTQLDTSLSDRDSFSGTFSLNPHKLHYLGLNKYTPQPATPDLRQRGEFLSFAHTHASKAGALLTSRLSFKQFDSNVKANSYDPYRLFVETTTGGFFSLQDRNTDRIEWQETYAHSAINRWGQHQPKVGLDIVRNTYDGKHTFRSVDVLRASGALAERTGFATGGLVSVNQQEYTGFVFDKWAIHPRGTIDAGLRFDRDSISDVNHLAPRLGFAISPSKDSKTVIRGGAGLFYDRINLNIPSFPQLPERTVTRFRADGSVFQTLHYAHRLDQPFDNPRSFAWNVEVQREVLPQLLLRTGYSQRNTVHDYFLEPIEEPDESVLLLSNTGRNRYREFQVTGQYRFRSHVLNGSYVRSSVIGDLNDFNQFFGNVPNPIIRPNERSRQTFDAPDRVLVWGQFEAPWLVTISPVFDIHTGFPHSVIDEERYFIGGRNRAGRFPWFSSLDIQITKRIDIPVRGKTYKLHVGTRIFNAFNHFNPRDFQSNLSSVRYGAFMNGVGRIMRGKFVLEF